MVARLAVTAQRPQARPQVARVERGEPLSKAWMPPLPQDKGEALVAGGTLAVPPRLLEGRVSTMDRRAQGPEMAQDRRTLDRLFSSPLPMPQPAVWRGPVPPVRLAASPVPPARPQARTAAVAAWAAAVQVPVIDTQNARPDVLAGLSPLAVWQALRPDIRREDFRVVVAAATVSVTPRASAPALSQGSGLCGVPVLSGRALGTVAGPGACGVENAVEVTGVGGIRLSPAVTIDCHTASAFATWVERVANPQIGGQGGGLARIETAGGYSCRGRNNVAGARLSEHAKGHAIDVMGFVLRDGSRLTVRSRWGNRVLREMHRGACGIFGTVLGPSANAAHHDHFHFDTARYRAGAYCR